MIEISFFSSGDEYADISSYIFGGIIGLMGIVGAILLFTVERKLSQINSGLENLNNLFARNELNYENFKMGMAIYALQWNYASYDTSFKILLISFFVPSFILVDIYLYLSCNNAFNDSSNLIFITLNIPLFAFLLIVYELIFAPDTMIFNKWRPSKLITSQYPFNETMDKYYGFLDMEDLQKLECNRFFKLRLKFSKEVDKLTIFFMNNKDNLPLLRSNDR